MPAKKDRSARCERPNCSRYAKYDAPMHLCSKHWKMWWRNGLLDKHTWWLRSRGSGVKDGVPKLIETHAGTSPTYGAS